MYVLYPDNTVFEYAFIGFVGSMLINAIMPHLFFTIIYRRYCPGIFTGCFLIVPFHIVILVNAANNNLVMTEMIVSTIIVSLILLSSIFIFEKLAKVILV